MPEIGVIGLVPAEDFERFMRELRARYPEAKLTAVIGAAELQLDGLADEYVLWGAYPARALVGELRRRRFDLLTVAYNVEYTYTFTYWKALVLALTARAKGLLFCEQAQLPAMESLQALGRRRALAAALLSAAGRMIVQPILYLAREAAIIAMSSLLVLVLLGIIAVDAVDGLVGLLFRRGRKRDGVGGSTS